MVVFFISLLNFSFFEIEGLSSSVIAKDINKSFYLNPCFLCKEKNNLIFLSYSNPYQFPSLNYFNGEIKYKKFGFLIQNLYYPNYNENRFSFIYADKIKNFSYGFSPNLSYFKIVNDGDFFFTYHLGLTYHLDKISFYLAFFNINKPKIWNEVIREKIIFGIEANFIKNLTISTFYLKTKEEEIFKIGFNFSFNKYLSFGQEFSFLPFITNFKFDLLIKEHFGIYYFLNFHYKLKDTHLFAIYLLW